MTAADLASRLGARRVGRGKWLAKCPVHHEKTPSLSITIGRKQPVMVHCFGCGADAKQVAASLGITLAELCSDRPMDRRAIRKLEQERADSEARRRAMRQLVLTAISKASSWYALSERYGARLAAFPSDSGLYAKFHNALARARRFEAIADELDDPCRRGLGVPRCTMPAMFR